MIRKIAAVIIWLLCIWLTIVFSQLTLILFESKALRILVSALAGYCFGVIGVVSTVILWDSKK